MAKTKTKRAKAAMSATAFKGWLKAMGYNHSDAAKELGASRTSIIKWASEGAPRTVRLACAYLLSMK